MLKLVDVYTQPLHASVFLYDLLSERDPVANISHREMPTFVKHNNFVNSRPYKSWYIVYADHGPVGAIYLTMQNEIGIGILKAHQGLGYGKQAVCLLMEMHPGERFLANINPLNTRSIDMFLDLGFELVQFTYAKETT
jgi:RimJ/RimL family protein N-acetyltransferase